MELTEKQRLIFKSGTPWEENYHYARAVRIGQHVWISGTVASDKGDLVGQGDPYKQAKFAYSKIESALTSVGATMSDVVRTRVYVLDSRHIDKVARAHAETFKGITPVNTTVVVSGFAEEGYLVEIEVEAYILPA
jgi:enamine deaminase RidA (YjgF/YER057c/UK114 family)